MIRILAVIAAGWLSLSAAWALDPTEMLADPQMEARAQTLDHALRCVVCQSESLASSNAEWAQNARAVVREQVVAGQSDAQIKAFFVERYGEFVLMDPPKTGANLVLWLAGPAMLLIALFVGISFVRARSRAEAVADAGLSDAEAKRLRQILDDE